MTENRRVINWLDCIVCGSDEIRVRTESNDGESLNYGDECECLSCGAVGEVEIENGRTYIAWEEE